MIIDLAAYARDLVTLLFIDLSQPDLEKVRGALADAVQRVAGGVRPA